MNVYVTGIYDVAKKIVMSSFIIFSLQSCYENDYVLPSSLHLNGKIESITESSFHVDSKFGDPCRSDLKCIAMHFGMPCESRTIKFDNNGNILSVESDNSIQQYATYSDSKEILEEVMVDREGVLDYRIYNRNSNKLPLNIKYNNYCYKRIYPKRNHLFKFLSCSSISEQNWSNEPCSFKDTIVIIKEKGYYPYYEFHSALAFDKNGEFLYEFSNIPHRNYERSYSVESFYENGNPKLISERGFKNRLYYNKQGKIIKTECFRNNGDICSRTSYYFNQDKSVLEETYTSFLDENDITNTYSQYYFSPEGKIVKREWNYSDKSGSYRQDFLYDKNQRISKIDDYNIHRDEKGLVQSISIDNWEKNKTYKYEYIDFSKAYIKSLCDTDFCEYTKVETKYDEYNNWIEKVCYIEDEIVMYYIRVINYI